MTEPTMNQTAHHLLTFFLAVVAAAALAPSPAGALELAPPPTEPKPLLWAEIESHCIGNKADLPAVKWTVSNTTNSKHVFTLSQENQADSEFIVEPGETKTGWRSSPLWEDSHLHFAITWKSQNVMLAQAKPWFNCIEPILSVSFGPVDDQGRPCAGVVPVTIANTGDQTAQVHLYQKSPTVFKALTVKAESTETVDVPMLPGQHLGGSYLNYGSHEFFLEAEVVECVPPAPPEPPKQPEPPANDGDQSDDNEPSINENPGEPGGTLDPVDVPGSDIGEGLPEPAVSSFEIFADDENRSAVIGLDSEVAQLRARHLGVGLDSGPAVPGRWALGALALVAASLFVVLRRH
jgi:hypothetical protein